MYQVQVYCLNINALTQWTTFLWDSTNVRHLIYNATVSSLYIYSALLQLLRCNSLWLVWSLRLPKAQFSLVNACVTSLSANFSFMARSHKITWSQVLWTQDKHVLFSSKVFSSQDLYFTAGSRDSGVGQSVYQVLKSNNSEQQLNDCFYLWINVQNVLHHNTPNYKFEYHIGE